MLYTTLPWTALAVASALLPASCAEDEADTALDLELTPDPELSSAEQLAARIDTVLLVVDSPDGLYPLSAAQIAGNVQIKNVDADATELELVVTVPVPPGRLPWIRLRQGGLPLEKPLDLRLSGLRTTGGDAETVALGRVQGVRFTPGTTQPISIPFDIRPELLPPRVLGVSSVEDTTIPGCQVTQIEVLFSRPIEEASLLADGAVVVSSDVVPGDVVASELRLDSAGLHLIYVPANLSNAGAGQLSYHVHVGTDVRERESGIGLDQMPARPEAQSYEGDFLLECS